MNGAMDCWKRLAASFGGGVGDGGPGSGIKGHTTTNPRMELNSTRRRPDLEPHFGKKFGEGDEVKVTLHRGEHEGKTGYISQIAPSGHFFGVKDSSGKDLGYYHESDLAHHDGDDDY